MLSLISILDMFLNIYRNTSQHQIKDLESANQLIQKINEKFINN